MTTATDCRLPRLLAGVSDRPRSGRTSHLDLHEPLLALAEWIPSQIIDVVKQSCLPGHGGASFPVARKLEAVASRRGTRIVAANGTEGEATSKKHRGLLDSHEVPAELIRHARRTADACPALALPFEPDFR